MGDGRIGGSTGSSPAYGVAAGSAHYPVTHVRDREATLVQVAQRLAAQGVRVDVESLRKANPHIADSTKLTAGQQIRLPLSAGEDLPMVEGLSEPVRPDPAPPSAPSVPASGDPMAKSMAQVRLGSVADALRVARSMAQAGPRATGELLGVNMAGSEVRVKRVVGSPQGYDDRLQAIAVARMGGAEPAAVRQGPDGRWRALETTASADGAIRNVHGLPSSSRIGDLSKEATSLKARLKDLDEAVKSAGSRVPKALAQERREVAEKLGHTHKQLAPLVFGVPESEIQFNRSSLDRKAGKINITAKLSGGVEGPVFGQGDRFKGRVTAFEIGLDLLEQPGRAAGTLFHEVTHLKDSELAQKWLAKYEEETGRMFVEGEPGRKPFESWINAQAAKTPARLSKADAELITDMARGDRRTGEARAFVQEALAALHAGAPDVAAGTLAMYADNTATRNHRASLYGNPDDKSHAKDALQKELQQAYRGMPPDMQKQLLDAIGAARQANPEAWISQVKLSK